MDLAADADIISLIALEIHYPGRVLEPSQGGIHSTVRTGIEAVNALTLHQGRAM
jgi:hypothetical protein